MPHFVKKLLNVHRRTKATSMACQGVPTWSKAVQRDTQGAQSQPKERQRGLNDTQRRPTDHKYIHIHINKIFANSRSTPMQRPPSNNVHNGSRVYIYTYIYIYCILSYMLCFRSHFYMKSMVPPSPTCSSELSGRRHLFVLFNDVPSSNNDGI